MVREIFTSILSFSTFLSFDVSCSPDPCLGKVSFFGPAHLYPQLCVAFDELTVLVNTANYQLSRLLSTPTTSETRLYIFKYLCPSYTITSLSEFRGSLLILLTHNQTVYSTMDYLDTRFIVPESILNIFEKFYSEVWIKI